MDRDMIVDALGRVPLTAGLTREQADSLAQAVELRHAKKGQRILRADEPGQFMMFLISGHLNVVIRGDDEDREAIIDILGPGEFFGELSLLTGRTRSADVQASEDSAYFVLSRHEFERHILGNPQATRVLLKHLALRLLDTTAKVAQLTLLDVFRRVGLVLTTLGTEEETKEGKITVIEKRPTHKDLAAMTGTSREMITRALKELENQGHIKVEGKRILIYSLPK